MGYRMSKKKASRNDPDHSSIGNKDLENNSRRGGTPPRSQKVLFFMLLISAAVLTHPSSFFQRQPHYMIKGLFLVSGHLAGWAEFPIESGL